MRVAQIDKGDQLLDRRQPRVGAFVARALKVYFRASASQ
jgi:hypothetical protein